MQKQQAALRKSVVERTGRDEMNLAEFPLALLSQRNSAGKLSFVRERSLEMPNGTRLQQSWIVTASPEFGLPQPADEDVLLVLLKMASDNGFSAPLVHFTQCGLLQILQWPRNGWYFKRIEQSLDRLKSTTIKAKNAFWNNAVKAYQTRHFGVVDSYQLLEQSDHLNTRASALQANWVRFSPEFYSSVEAGYIKPINLSLYFSLNSSVSRRLFRYLDKKRYQKERFEIGIHQLADTHLGMSEYTCRYTSWIKRELDRAHGELRERGFIRSAEYGKTRDGEHKVTYSFSNTPTIGEQLALPLPASENDLLLDQLVKRGVSAGIARELIRQHAADFISRQMDVFDHLNRLSKLRNPGGFLTQSIREAWTLQPPGYVQREVREARVQAVARVEAAKAAHDEQRLQEQISIEQVRATLDEDALGLLREEAYERAKAQLGANYRLRRDGRMVEAFLNGILQERYIQGAAG